MKAKLTLGTLLLLLVLACVGPKVEVYERPDGTIIVESTEAKAKVTAIDTRANTITLKRSWHSGAKVFQVDPAVVNLRKIRVGDEVHVLLVEEFAVSLVQGGTPPEFDAAAAIAVAGPGEKPAMTVAAGEQVTADIIAIDGHSHKVTIRLPDGSVRTVKVAKHIDLTQVALGDSVLIQIIEAVAIEVVTPK
jgi:hypothetical protein